MDNSSPFRLPNGPPGRWRPTLRLIKDPRASLSDWADQYGDPFLLNALNGPVVVTGRQDLIKEIFSYDSSAYDVFASDAMKPMIGAGSMLMLDGEPHRRERKLVMPMFHGDRMRAYGDIMQQTTLDCMQRHDANQPFSMMETTTAISLQVIMRAVFGAESSESAKTLSSLAEQSMRRGKPYLFFSPKLHFKFLGISPWDRYLQAQERLNAALEQQRQSRETARQNGDLEKRDDIMSLLMVAEYEDGTGMTKEHLYHELGTFLFAGHETSAIAMAWAIYHLHRNPVTLNTLRREISEVEPCDPDRLAKLPYLKAVVQETLRIHPVIPEVLRKLNRPMELGDYYLPSGVAVAPAAVLAHYDEESFPDAEMFRPERFLKQAYSPAQYLPFGGGHRRCAGAAFANYEMMIVLGTMIANYQFELLEPELVVPKRRNITMGPSTGITVRYKE